MEFGQLQSETQTSFAGRDQFGKPATCLVGHQLPKPRCFGTPPILRHSCWKSPHNP